MQASVHVRRPGISIPPRLQETQGISNRSGKVQGDIDRLLFYERLYQEIDGDMDEPNATKNTHYKSHQPSKLGWWEFGNLDRDGSLKGLQEKFKVTGLAVVNWYPEAVPKCKGTILMNHEGPAPARCATAYCMSVKAFGEFLVTSQY